MIPSKIAGIVLNLFGLIMGFLHLVLRSNADVTAIRPMGVPWGSKRGWRFFGSSGLDIGAQLKSPVAIERCTSTRALNRSPNEKHQAMISPGSPGPTIDIRSPRAPKSLSASARVPKTLTRPGFARMKTNSRAFLPVNDARASRPSRPLGTNDAEFVLLPPQPLYVRRHQRDSSNISSATVQIGLRLSHGILPPDTEYLDQSSVVHLPIQSPDSPHSITAHRPSPLSREVNRDNSSTVSMELPIQFKPPTPSPQLPPLPQLPSKESNPGLLSQPPASQWPRRNVSLRNRDRRVGEQREQKPEGDYRMKSLPPVPPRPNSEVLTNSDRNSEYSQLSLPRRSMSNPATPLRRPSERDYV
jgi:hypothetical protein